MDFSVLLVALVGLLSSLASLLWGFANRRYSALYWLSVVAVFTAPALFDLLWGLPYKGLIRLTYPFADPGSLSVHLFSLLHIGCTSVCYALLSHLWLRSNPDNSALTPKLQIPVREAAVVFGIVFVAAAAVTVVKSSDLTRQWNDFLDPSSPGRYELYFLMASAPLMGLLEVGGRRSRGLSILVASVSVFVAWFIGIRYYMFPFVGYLVWNRIILLNTGTMKRLALVLGALAVGWIALAFWGVVRDVGVRHDPLRAIEAVGVDRISEVLKVGNELETRLAYYDLVGRLEDGSSFRGFESLEAAILTGPYPVVMRVLGLKMPASNSQLIYEILSGRVGTGVSHGATVFGNDWFSWGWPGCLIGGLIMGALLFAIDYAQKQGGVLWLLVGPLATFQLVFFARGGTDAFLGNWLRTLPISAVLLVIAHLFAQRRSPISKDNVATFIRL